MKQYKKAFELAKARGMNIVIDKSLSKNSGVVLFPKQLAHANKILSQVKMPLP